METKEYGVPYLVATNDEVRAIYDDTMRILFDRYIQIIGMLEDLGVPSEVAEKQASFVLCDAFKYVRGCN